MVTDTSITADAMLRACQVAEMWFVRNREGVNAINVYPVPDGDTGTNMLATWRAALRAAPEDPTHVGDLLAAMSGGALMGARGNSGVILSQMIRGLAEALEGNVEIDTAALVGALWNAATTAHAAMTNPVEGTMLTVMRDTASGAHAASTTTTDLAAVLAAATDAAQASVRRTPDLLYVLREAGVVDAGGMGIAVLVQGLAYGFSGEPLPDEPLVSAGEQVDLTGVAHEGHGYCTEFIVQGEGINRDALEQALADAGGDSILVVGTAETMRVHVHVEDPESALAIAATMGTLEQVKTENMQAQHERWAEARADAANGDDPDPENLPAVGLVAVVPGPGIALAFRDLGAGRVIDASEQGKASAGEILEAARHAGREHVFVLPNDKDVLMAAEQAARASEDFITVIPTRSVPQGISAAAAYMSSYDRETLLEEMTAAVPLARCVEVSRASREATVDGIAVRPGDAIAFLDGQLVARADELDGALVEGLEAGGAGQAELITLYLGVDADEDATARLGGLLAEAFPDAEQEFFAGRQPHYPYIAGIE